MVFEKHEIGEFIDPNMGRAGHFGLTSTFKEMKPVVGEFFLML